MCGCDETIASRQRETTTRRDLLDAVREGVDFHVLGDFAREHRQPARRIDTAHLRPGSHRPVHRSRHVHQKTRLALQLGVALDRSKHGVLQLRLEVRRVLCGRDEAVGQHTVGAHVVERLADRLLGHARVLHAAKVAQQRQCAELLVGDQALERFLLIGPAREGDLPGVRRLKRAIDQLLPDLFLGGVLRLGVRDEQHIAQTHGAVAVVLRQLVSVEQG